MKKTYYINSKKLTIISTILLATFLCVVYIFFGQSFNWFAGFSNSTSITDDPVFINYNQNNLCNSRQLESRTVLTVTNGTLCFWERNGYSSKFSGYLAAFQHGTIEPIRPNSGTYLATDGPFVYYYKNAAEKGLFYRDVFCYNIESMQETLLFTHYSYDGSDLNSWECFFDQGMLHIPKDNVDYQYYPIVGAIIGEPVEKELIYTYGDRSYVVGIRNNPTIIGYDTLGKITQYNDLLSPGLISVIPCEDGLLIHNERYGDLLHYIDGQTGELQTLFTTTCERSYSAVNVWGEYAYLSVVRFETYDKFAKPYANDTISGTYRINLHTLSVERISDEFYRGLYIFDDSGIFATDKDGNIFNLDFDGNVVRTLLKY